MRERRRHARAGLAAAVAAGVTVASGASLRSEESPALLTGYRCMMAAKARGDAASEPPAILSAPRAGASVVGTAEDPVIGTDPLQVVNGFARVLLHDGQPGWTPRRRLAPWKVGASPGLRCLPARSPKGRIEAIYAHPG